MNVKLSILREEELPAGTGMAQELSSAVEDGSFHTADSLIERLLSSSQSAPSIIIPGSQWQEFITSLKNRIDSFSSDFIIPPAMIQLIVSLDFDEAFSPIVSFLQDAKQQNTSVLQIPYQEEV